MRATRTFTDKFGIKRKNGEEWLIKMEDIDAHIPDVYEEVRHVQLAVTILCLSGLATVSAGNSFVIVII